MLDTTKPKRDADPVQIRMQTAKQSDGSLAVSVQISDAPFGHDGSPKTVQLPKILDALVPRFYRTSLLLEEAVAIGRALGLVAFAGISPGDLHRYIEDADRPRRIILKFRRKDAALIMLPWEMLRTDFDADDEASGLRDGTADLRHESFSKAQYTHFLAIRKGVSIVRVLEDVDRVHHEEDLRGVIAIFSNPTEMKDLQLSEEKNALWELLSRSKRKLLQGRARRDDFSKELEDAGKAHLRLMHFSGHGRVGPSHEGGSALLMEDVPTGEPVSAKDLALYLKNARMSIAVLNACETATESDDVTYGPAIGTSLFEQGVAAVIAMQTRIHASAGKLFARNFYATLIDGASLDDALNDARMQMFSSLKGAGKVQAFSPVLYRHYERAAFADVPPPSDFDNGQNIHEDSKRVADQRQGLWRRLLAVAAVALGLGALTFIPGTGGFYNYVANVAWGVLLVGGVATTLVIDAYWKLRQQLLAATAVRLHELELKLKADVGHTAESPEDVSDWIQTRGKHRALMCEWQRATRVRFLFRKLVPRQKLVNDSRPTNRDVAESIVGRKEGDRKLAHD